MLVNFQEQEALPKNSNKQLSYLLYHHPELGQSFYLKIFNKATVYAFLQMGFSEVLQDAFQLKF